MPQPFCICLTTTSSMGQAQELAKSILGGKLAACVNTIKIEKSFFFWEGKLNEDSEVLLLIKTNQAMVAALELYLKNHHPYKCHLFTVIETNYVNQAYEEWLEQSLSK